jgi:hypothetical protein
MTDEPDKPEKKAWYKRPWVIILGVLILIGIVAGGGSDSGDDNPDSGTEQAVQNAPPPPPSDTAEQEDAEPAAADDCGFTATDDCTPHVLMGKTVRVDAMIWRVDSVRVAQTIGDQQYGLGAKADGAFVIVKLRVRSDKDESATLSDDVVKLETHGNTYDPDNDGSVAAIGAGDEPFFLETIGPDSTERGTVVFDVPKKVLSQTVELRFGELGFGPTHGYIRIPNSRLS